MKLEEFVKKVLHESASSDIIKSSEVKIEAPIVKIRLKINTTCFIDIFRNFETSTVSYSLIEDKKRIYAADKDSIRDWHLHPFKNPDKHKKSDKITFKKFLSDTEKHFHQKNNIKENHRPNR